MQEIRSKVSAALQSGTGARIHRERIESGWLNGRVVAIGEDLFAIELVSDAIYLDGFVCLRFEDVSDIECPAPNWAFVEKALSLRRQRFSGDVGLNCSSVATLIGSISSKHELISIHCETVDPDCCYIGRVVNLDENAVLLSTIDPDAKWDSEPTSIRLNEITRLDFGGSYEDALSIVASAG